MPTEQEKLFVVVDPNDSEHVALQRAIITSKLRKTPPKIFVFIGVDAEAVDTRATNDNVFRDHRWFQDQIIGPLEECGFEFEIEISWSSQWGEAIMNEARRFGSTMIMVPVHAKTNPRRFTFAESRWTLMENAECPVLLVRPGARQTRKTVLAAVNFQAVRDEQKALNERIIAQGKRTAERYGAEFHVVNAYRDSLNYPDRGRLANQTGLPASHIHVEHGYTDEVVAAVAEQVDADMVVVGTLNQRGVKATARRGHTVARVISALDVDTMVLN